MLCGAWNGRRWSLDDPSGVDMCWVLSLNTSSAYPSAFGASQQQAVLHGSYSLAEQTVSLSCVSYTDDGKKQGILTFDGRLKHGSLDSLSLQGVWKSDCGKQGMFALGFEDESNSFISGVWLGQATPDESLVPFCIPTNPIRWVVCFLNTANNTSSNSSSDSKVSALFGAGYFDDAAEAQQQNGLLFFLLKGNSHVTQEGKLSFEFMKIYERLKDVEACFVSYKGAIDCNAIDKVMEGNWDNKTGGSFGNFRCRRARTATVSGSLRFCRVCDNVLTAEGVRYVCYQCPASWECCASCYSESKEETAVLSQQEQDSQQQQQQQCKKFHAHELHEEEGVAAECAEGTNCMEIVQNALYRFADRPFIGILSHDSSKASTLIAQQQQHIKWLFYKDIGHAARLLASSLQQHVSVGDPIALIGNLSPSYVVVTLAAVLLGAILVPLDPLLDSESLIHCLRMTKPLVIFADALQCIEGLSSIVVRMEDLFRLGNSSSTPLPLYPPFTISLYALTSEVRLARRVIQSDDVIAILFTSGTTGFPKGAAYTDHLCKPAEGLGNTHPLVRLDLQTFHPSFLISLLGVIQAGGRRVFCTDPTRWLVEVPLARPTHISAPPLFWSTLQNEYLFLESTVSPKAAADSIRHVLGNRVVSAHTGGAAVSQSVLDLFHELGFPLDDLYGCREAGGIARNGKVYPGVDVFILPVKDKQTSETVQPATTSNGNDIVGEILVHSKRLIPEYFGASESTDAAFLWQNGKRFYRTGDIGCLKSGKLKIFGRVGASVKLETGKWLHPTNVETVLESNPLIHQSLVYALPRQSFPVSVVVLSPLGQAQVKKAAAASDAQDGETWLLNELRFWCAHHHLAPQEIPQALCIEPFSWTEAQGLLTPTMKKKRNAIIAKYKDIWHKLSETSKQNESSELSQAFLQVLKRAGIVLGTIRVDSTLAEAGANSLGVARLVQLFRESKVEISVKVMYLKSLSYLDGLLTRGLQGKRIVSVEDDIFDNYHEHDLGPSTAIQHINNTRSAILITGATGFFGSYLVPQVLEAFPTFLVYVLIRGSSNRLEEWLHSTQTWSGCERIRPLSGDVSLSQLGLSDDSYGVLQASLRDVFHCAARVDVAAPLEALVVVNVDGTRRIIELCLKSQARLHYFSSLSALAREPLEDWNVIEQEELRKKTGYGASKAKAEALIHKAVIERGLEARVIRTGTVCGDEDSGLWNDHDFILMLLKAWFTLGAVIAPTSMLLRWLPAPFIAKAMVQIALSPLSANRCFNIVGSGPTLSELSDELLLQSRRTRHRCVVIEPAAWPSFARKLKDDHALLVEQFCRINFQISETQASDIPSASTTNLLTSLNLPVPHIGRSYVATCVKHVIASAELESEQTLCPFCGY